MMIASIFTFESHFFCHRNRCRASSLSLIFIFSASLWSNISSACMFFRSFFWELRPSYAADISVRVGVSDMTDPLLMKSFLFWLLKVFPL